jgi:hypothetical protein
MDLICCGYFTFLNICSDIQKNLFQKTFRKFYEILQNIKTSASSTNGYAAFQAGREEMLSWLYPSPLTRPGVFISVETLMD